MKDRIETLKKIGICACCSLLAIGTFMIASDIIIAGAVIAAIGAAPLAIIGDIA